MRGLLYFLLSITVFIMLSTRDVSATHTSGFEFHYFWQSDSTYEFNLTFFRHCTGFTAGSQPTQIVIVESDSFNFSFTDTLYRMPFIGGNVPPLEPKNVYSCSPQLSLCVEEYVYRGEITFPFKADDWVISADLCCRPNELDNLNPTSSIRTECGLNNLDFQDSLHQNSSPMWHTRRPNIPGHLLDTLINYPVWSACEYQTYIIDQSAVDYQNDSIVYSLVHYQRDSFGSVTYISPYSDSMMMPVDSLNPLVIDSVTGMINYSPVYPFNLSLGAIRMFQFAIKATEYRYDSFLVGQVKAWEARPIGHVIRNIESITTDSSQCPYYYPPFGQVLSNLPIFDMRCTDTLIRLNLESNVLCSTVDSNASCFLLIEELSGDTIKLKKAWVETCSRQGDGYRIIIEPDTFLSQGNYFLMFKMGDDSNTVISSCGPQLPAYEDTIRIELDSTFIGNLLGDKLNNNIYDNKISILCSDSTVNINLSTEILCSSVAIDGSDFQIWDVVKNPPLQVPILYANPICNKGLTDQIQIKLAFPLSVGTHTLYTIIGSDSNIFLNDCGDMWLAESIPVKVIGPEVNLGPDLVFCNRANISVTFNAGSGYASYKWNVGVISSQYLFVNNTGKYYVTVTDYNGCTASDTVYITRKSCVGLAEWEDERFNIFPNPVKDNLFIENDDIEYLNIELTDIYGRRILNKRNYALNRPLDLSSVPQGIYQLTLKGIHTCYSIIIIKE